MAKTRPVPDAPNRPAQGSPAIIIVIGAIIVIALVAFSFSRTLRTPAPAPGPTSGIAQQSPASPQTAATEAGNPAAAPSFPAPASPRQPATVPIAPPFPAPSDAAPTQAQIAAVPRITPGDLLQKLEGKQVTLIDVRDVDSYRARHIPGALHIPLSFIAGEVPYLPKDKPIVTYCT